jgi:hypothetical protein
METIRRRDYNSIEVDSIEHVLKGIETRARQIKAI